MNVKMPVTKYGEAQRNHRLSLNLTQKEYADKWGIQRTQVCSYESTEQVPGPRLLRRLNKAFGVRGDVWAGIELSPESAPATPPPIPFKRRGSQIANQPVRPVQTKFVHTTTCMNCGQPNAPLFLPRSQGGKNECA